MVVSGRGVLPIAVLALPERAVVADHLGQGHAERLRLAFCRGRGMAGLGGGAWQVKAGELIVSRMDCKPFLSSSGFQINTLFFPPVRRLPSHFSWNFAILGEI